MKNRIMGTAAFGLALGLLAPLAAQADVKLEHYTRFGGVLGVGASDITTTEYLQGLKMREESSIKFTGAVLGALQRLASHGDKGSGSVSILRVDENKRYSLKPDKKTYSESPLYQPEKKDDSAGKDKDDDDDTKITKNEFTVKDTGQKKTINGWDCHEYVITWHVETENTKNHEKGKSVMTSDLWNASDAKLQKARDEQLAYSKAYLKLMHLPTNPDELKQFGFGAATISGADSKAFFDKLHTVKGYPVSIDVTWEASSTGGDKDKSSQDADSQDDKDAVKALGNLLGSKSDDSKKTNDDGMTTVFTSHTELKSVDTGSLDKGLFSVPADYTQD